MRPPVRATPDPSGVITADDGGQYKGRQREWFPAYLTALYALLFKNISLKG